MDTGHKLGLMLLYCVMAGYAGLLLPHGRSNSFRSGN
mgnify:CR=1 FL=1